MDMISEIVEELNEIAVTEDVVLESVDVKDAEAGCLSCS
jgi:hypothetical protein